MGKIMGYSVSVKFSNKNELEEMRTFLLKNSDILEQLKSTDIHQVDLEPIYGEDLGYAPKKKHLLGFHGIGIPRYVWDLCAWMSVKSSYRDPKRGMFFYYDKEKMLVTFDLDNHQNTVVDHDGIRVEKEKSFASKIASSILGFDANIKQRELFIQLNNNWDQYKLL
jgi:hypothetical protein